jgi:GT2 family glycosyltransferase
MPDLDVDVIVLSWREIDLTLGAVTSVLTEDRVASVIVVDNESSGALSPRLPTSSGSRVDVLENLHNLGFAAGVNSGVELALARPAPMLMIMNNDARLLPGSLDAMVSRLDGRVGMVGPVFVDKHGKPFARGGSFSPVWMRAENWSTGTPDFLTWACVIADKDVFRTVGLLDERFFMYWEDVEFGVRMKAAGLPMDTVPGARVQHLVSASHAKAGARISVYSAMGLVLMGRLMGIRSWPGTCLRILGRLTRALLRRDWAVARAVVTGTVLGITIRSGERGCDRLGHT